MSDGPGAPDPDYVPLSRNLLQALGPGLITGAADDEPSGIATYSQIGAQFGYALGWAMLLSYPLMAVIQQISAEIGSVTGAGIDRIKALYWSAVLNGLLAAPLMVTLLLIATNRAIMGGFVLSRPM